MSIRVSEHEVSERLSMTRWIDRWMGRKGRVRPGAWIEEAPFRHGARGGGYQWMVKMQQAAVRAAVRGMSSSST